MRKRTALGPVRRGLEPASVPTPLYFMPFASRFRHIALALVVAAVIVVPSTPAVAEAPRYVGRLADGSLVQGKALTEVKAGRSDPQLDGQPIGTADKPLRWLRDRSRTLSGPPSAMIELIGGDRIPGTVVGYRRKAVTAAGTIPAHFIIELSIHTAHAGSEVNRPVRVVDSFVRRIVWRSRAGTASLKPKTVLLRNGATVVFRSARFFDGGMSLLCEEGSRRVTFDEIAECRLPPRDPWKTYYDELAILCPNGPAPLTQVETNDGLIATVSAERIVAGRAGQVDQIACALAPAWLLDPIWISGRTICLRRTFAVDLVPLSRFVPALAGGGGQPSRWRSNRNAYGRTLVSGRREYGGGFGVHGRAELAFPVPPLARALHASVGLDAEAGQGGCVRARVFAGSTKTKPLYESPLLIGSQSVAALGRVALPPSNSTGTLILQVDEAHVGRPRGADPFDLRDLTNWLEPRIELDPSRLAAEIKGRRARTIGAWDEWQVQFDPRGTYRWHTTLQSAPRPGSAELTRGLHVAGAPLTLQREIRIDDDHRWLALLIRREQPAGKITRPEIEVRVDGQIVATRPIRSGPPEAMGPLAFDLAAHRGRTVRLEVVQHPAPDGAAPVLWQAMLFANQPPNLRRLFEDDGPLVTQPQADDPRVRLVDTGALTGRRAVQVMSGGRATLKLRDPVAVRLNPKQGEHRYLRFAVRKLGGGRVCVELGPGADGGNLLARYDAGIAVPARPTKDRVWFDDELPRGAIPNMQGGQSQWHWVSGDGNPVFSGKQSLRRQSPKFSQHFFMGADPPLAINAGDKLFMYVYLDPKDPPKELVLSWHNGKHWEHRAYWGENLFFRGVEGSPARRAMGPLPELGKWVRLEVDAVEVGLLPGAELRGWSCTQIGGTVWWDKAGIHGPGEASYGLALRAWPFELPDEWVIVTRDLAAEFGEADVSELSLHVPDGRHALFDHVYLARTIEDFALVAPSNLVRTSHASVLRHLAPEVMSRGLPAIVTVEVDGRRGMGVIVGDEGYVLSMGRLLIGDAKDVTVTLDDGSTHKGRTLGVCRDFDCGLIRLAKPLPGRGVTLYERNGTEHPFAGLYVGVEHYVDEKKQTRLMPRVVDLRGRTNRRLWTTPRMQNVAAGTPLLDSRGRLIGMYARPTISYLHDLFISATAIHNQWERLVAGEVWGTWYQGTGPMLGVIVTSTPHGAIVTGLLSESPAAAQGVKLGDRIRKADGKGVNSLRDLYNALANRDPGDEIAVELQRDGQKIQQKVRLVHRTERR